MSASALWPLTFGSVCSGIEAASVAWAPLGWRAGFVSEVEPAPAAVLIARHGATRPLFPLDPGEPGLTAKEAKKRAAWRNAIARMPQGGALPNFGDMTRFQEWPDAAIDLLVGGTPCQSFSLAGLRRGLADPRGSLMLTFGALARRFRPTWLVWENVPGVLSSNGGRDFGAFLGMLGELGYGFAYRVLDARYFGVPQRRRRVFVIGYLGDWRPPLGVLFEPESLRGDIAPRAGAGRDVAGAPAAGAGGWDESGGAQPAAFGGNDTRGARDVAASILTAPRDDFKTDTLIAFTAKDWGGDASTDCAPTLRAMGNAQSHANAGGQLAIVEPYTIEERGREHGRSLEYRDDGTANALLTPNGGRAGIGVGAIAELDRVRRLTPRECERLQGFPDDYTAIPYRRGIMCDGPRYRMLGNSMAVPVMAWLGARIDRVRAAHRALLATSEVRL